MNPYETAQVRQAEVFDTCKDLVQSALDGYNAGDPSKHSWDPTKKWSGQMTETFMSA